MNELADDLTEPTESQRYHLGGFLGVRPHVIKECWGLFQQQNLVESLISSGNTTKTHQGPHDELVKNFALHLITGVLPKEEPQYRAKIDAFHSVLKSGKYSSKKEAQRFFNEAAAEIFPPKYDTCDDLENDYYDDI